MSFAGVEYDILRHELTAAQIEIYDTYADAWAILWRAAHKIAYREEAVMRRSAA
nr:strawberry notch family protein [Sphingomonas sp. S-NIH.Pt1_0416]